jgi:molybdopterin/thiamine biosynthesis adenylyltransferase
LFIMPAPELTNYDLRRYDRQMLIRGFGGEGQRKLKGSTAFIAGCGGLGSPIATYLAVAGVGTLVIADMDIVDLSNLNRQILHWDKNVGEDKVKSAYDKLVQINPSINVVPFNGRVDEENVLELTKGCDIIMDALDNFETRYLLNRASLHYKIPMVHGSIWGLEGRVTTLVPGKTPCLECIVPKAPPEEVFPALGATAGVIGTIQATEAVKVLTGVGTPLINRLLIYDGEYMEFHELKIAPNPECPVCGTSVQAAKTK